jgi:nitroreductase
MDLQTIDHLLTTTRSVRKRLDFNRPVEPEVLARCIEIAMQAPTASNRQHWHFVVVTEADKRQQIADYYRKAFSAYASKASAHAAQMGEQQQRVVDSAVYLAEHMHEVPVFVIPCAEGRVEKGGVEEQAAFYGSILPAAWSLMLALRARGLGSAWTTLHLVYEKEVAELLGLPPQLTQTVLLPVAYYTGADFQPAKRRPAWESIHWNTFGHHQQP